jgi:hypothetical protein
MNPPLLRKTKQKAHFIRNETAPYSWAEGLFVDPRRALAIWR